MGSSSNMSDLPEDMAAEVLVRVDAEMALRLRGVSKSWKTLIDSPEFRHRHMQYGAGITQLVCFTWRNDVYMTRCMDGSVIKIEIETDRKIQRTKVLNPLTGSCNGLLCLVRYCAGEFKVVVMNPCTKQYFVLPLAMDYTAIGFGHDSVNDDYKVVIFDSEPSLCSFQVYSFRSKCWRDILEPPNHKVVPHKFGLNTTRGILVNGALHWITFDNDADEYAILAFGLAAEKFRTFPLHEEVNATLTKEDEDENFQLDLGDVDGCLSLFFNGVSEDGSIFFNGILEDGSILQRRRPYFELRVWTMKEYGVPDSWTRVNFVEEDDVEWRDPVRMDLYWRLNLGMNLGMKLGILYDAWNENKADDLLHLNTIYGWTRILTLTPTLVNLLHKTSGPVGQLSLQPI